MRFEFNKQGQCCIRGDRTYFDMFSPEEYQELEGLILDNLFDKQGWKKWKVPNSSCIEYLNKMGQNEDILSLELVIFDSYYISAGEIKFNLRNIDLDNDFHTFVQENFNDNYQKFDPKLGDIWEVDGRRYAIVATLNNGLVSRAIDEYENILVENLKGKEFKLIWREE